MSRGGILALCPSVSSYELCSPAPATTKLFTGQLVLAIFVILQLADGLITFQAVALFGTVAEGNPLLATWMTLVGAGPALFGAKAVACACATFLYQRGYRRVLAGLATVYAVAAVGPWLHILTMLGQP